MKCPKLHDQTTDHRGNCLHMPHISRFQNSKGKDLITLWPPLSDAWNAFFSSNDKPITVGASVTDYYNGDQVCTYELSGMKDPDWTAITAADVSGAVFIGIGDGRTKKYKSNKARPQYLAHGTGFAEGLSILLDGGIRPSPGIAGTGIYGFDPYTLVGACPGSPDTLLTKGDYQLLWDRTQRGGYNFGCLIVSWLLSVSTHHTNKYQVCP
jgi:hypothetical protein